MGGPRRAPVVIRLAVGAARNLDITGARPEAAGAGKALDPCACLCSHGNGPPAPGRVAGRISGRPDGGRQTGDWPRSPRELGSS